MATSFCRISEKQAAVTFCAAFSGGQFLGCWLSQSSGKLQRLLQSSEPLEQ